MRLKEIHRQLYGSDGQAKKKPWSAETSVLDKTKRLAGDVSAAAGPTSVLHLARAAIAPIVHRSRYNFPLDFGVAVGTGVHAAGAALLSGATTTARDAIRDIIQGAGYHAAGNGPTQVEGNLFNELEHEYRTLKADLQKTGDVPRQVEQHDAYRMSWDVAYLAAS